MESVGEILRKSASIRSQTSTATSSSDSAAGTGESGRRRTLSPAEVSASQPQRDLLDGAHGGEPDCPHCRGTGFVMLNVPSSDPRFGRAQVCVCRQMALDIENQVKLAQVSQLGLLRDATFDTFKPDGLGLTPTKQLNLKIAYKHVRDYADNPSGWLILRGGYGCGKTHLAAAVANHRIDLGYSALFVNTPDLLDHLRAAYGPNAGTTYDERFQEVKTAPLLILDDLGTQSNTSWAQEKLYQIFNYRYTAKLPTIITTNEELEAIDIRIRSRMADPSMSQIITILAPDYRRAGVDQDQSDLSSLNLHHDKSFDNFDLRDDELPRAQADNLRRAFDTARTFADDPRDWLVLNSIAYANGKTHLAAAVANHLARNGEAVLFIVVPDLLDHLRATFNPQSGTSLDKRFLEVKTAPLLILDDLGTESATAWAREKLYQLFNYRYNARLPTVITTTTPIDEIDPRLASRLLDGSRCTFFVIEAPSYRGGARKNKKGNSGRGRRSSR